MKRFWFFFRILLDVFGVLMVMQWLFIFWLFFVDIRSEDMVGDKEWVAEDSYPDVAAAAPAYNSPLIGMELGSELDWQVIGTVAQQRCDPQHTDQFLQFKHRDGRAPIPAAQTAWQRVEDNPALNAYLLGQLTQSPCRHLLARDALNQRLPGLWIRLRAASWRDGNLTKWMLYLYDPHRNAVYLWSDSLPVY